MRLRFSGLLVKFRLFLPTFLGILLAVTILAFLIIRLSNREIHYSIGHNLQLEVQAISRMFDRERKLKTEKESSRPGEFHPQPLTEPYLTVSRHTALLDRLNS